jgi:hypothetical protein
VRLAVSSASLALVFRVGELVVALDAAVDLGLCRERPNT